MTTTVSFKLAKLLKEKEYNKLCNKLWHFNGSDCIVMPNKNSENFGFSAPTIAEVVMWLYEKHGIWIEVRKLTNKWIIPIPNDDRKGEWFALGKSYKTCEEAELECLRKLIEIVKTSKL